MRITKMYSTKAIGICTFFFGPLAGGYMILRNFRTLQDDVAVRKCKITFTIVIVLFCLYLLSPYSLPIYINNSLPILFTVIIYQYAVSNQGSDIDKFIKTGGQYYSGWKAFAVSLCALLITIIYIFGILFVGFII